MPTAVETVNAFLAECGQGKPAMRAAFRAYFTPATVWENVGLATTTGIDEALALLDRFEGSLGLAFFKVDMLAIAAQGDRVLTERVDRLVNAEGVETLALRLMGIFEVEAGRLRAWRDYADATAFAATGS